MFNKADIGLFIIFPLYNTAASLAIREMGGGVFQESAVIYFMYGIGYSGLLMIDV